MDVRYANRARQTGPTALQAPHSPKPRLPSMGGPLRSAPPAGYMKTAPPTLVARRASQITPSCPIQRNHDQALPSSEFFSSLLEGWDSILAQHLHLPSAVIGAVAVGLGWVLRSWASAWVNARRERDKDALQACRELRRLIPAWNAGVRLAVTKGKTFEELNDALMAFREGGQFEPDLATKIPTLEPLDECADAVSAAKRFKNEILDVKRYLGTLLGGDGEKFGNDFANHRDEALNRLRAPLDACSRELDNAISVLERRRDRAFPWLDRIFSTTRHQAAASG
jgi:hypothetical protein